MTTRAKRRDDARIVAKVMEKSGTTELDTISELAATRRDLDIAKGYLKTYKTRLERLAMGLQFVSNALISNKIQEAQTAMRALNANDLAEAREAVGNRSMALDILARALEKGTNTPESREALERARILAPEAFGGVVAMTQSQAANG